MSNRELIAISRDEWVGYVYKTFDSSFSIEGDDIKRIILARKDVRLRTI